MKHLFRIATLTCITIVATQSAYAQYHRYLTPEANRTIVTLDATDESPTISAPQWVEAELTNGVEVESGRKVSVLIIRHNSTDTYRTAILTVRFRDFSVEVRLFQAAPLNFGRHENELVTHSFPPDEVKKAWFTPENGETLPDILFSGNKKGGTVFSIPQGKGTFWVETFNGLYAATF